MVEPDTGARIDEVSRYYVTPKKVAQVLTASFYLGAVLSLAMPYVNILGVDHAEPALTVAFLVVALTHFTLLQGQSHYWLPRAERQRRLRLLSDGLGANLNHDRTQNYYNNQYSPSIQRLGANVMENALFGAAVTAEMLGKVRLKTGAYAIAWLVAFATRHNELALLVGITQFVFSAGVLANWINLEVLHSRFETCHNELHAIFRSDSTSGGPNQVASILNVVVSYEVAKSAAGILLDERLFECINPAVTSRWNRIRADLNMDS